MSINAVFPWVTLGLKCWFAIPARTLFCGLSPWIHKHLGRRLAVVKVGCRGQIASKNSFCDDRGKYKNFEEGFSPGPQTHNVQSQDEFSWTSGGSPLVWWLMVQIKAGRQVTGAAIEGLHIGVASWHPPALCQSDPRIFYQVLPGSKYQRWITQ